MPRGRAVAAAAPIVLADQALIDSFKALVLANIAPNLPKFLRDKDPFTVDEFIDMLNTHSTAFNLINQKMCQVFGMCMIPGSDTEAILQQLPANIKTQWMPLATAFKQAYAKLGSENKR